MQFFFLNERFAPEVSEQPELDLHHWRLFRAASGEAHLSAEIRPGTMRITTPVVVIDLPKACCITLSGRRYRLCSPPESGELLRTFLHANAQRGGLVDAVDVSDTIWSEIASRAESVQRLLQDML